MEMKSYQGQLAKLYTNESFRNTFFADREKVIAGLSLRETEAMQLMQLSKEQVEDFAKSLLHKRAGEVRALLPNSRKAIGGEFDKLFFSYAASLTVNGVHKHQQDAVQFAGFLLERFNTNEFLRDLIRYERNRVQRYLSRKLLIIEKYNHSPQQLFDCIAHGRELKASRKKQFHIYYRTRPRELFSLIRL